MREKTRLFCILCSIAICCCCCQMHKAYHYIDFSIFSDKDSVQLSELCGMDYSYVEIHRAPLDIEIPENCREYDRNEIPETLSVMILRDDSGNETFFWYNMQYVFYDSAGELIQFRTYSNRVVVQKSLTKRFAYTLVECQ